MGRSILAPRLIVLLPLSANLHIFEAKVSARGLECTCSEAHGASLLSDIIFVATLCEFAYFTKPIGPQRAGA